MRKIRRNKMNFAKDVTKQAASRNKIKEKLQLQFFAIQVSDI